MEENRNWTAELDLAAILRGDAEVDLEEEYWPLPWDDEAPAEAA